MNIEKLSDGVLLLDNQYVITREGRCELTEWLWKNEPETLAYVMSGKNERFYKSLHLLDTEDQKDPLPHVSRFENII